MTTRARPLPPLLTPADVTDMLRVSARTLARYRSRGLPFVMLSDGTIRYRADDLARYIEDKTQCHTAQKARKTGTLTSRSGVVDFTEAAAQRTSKKRKPSKPPSA